jgi:hypothetical protein
MSKQLEEVKAQLEALKAQNAATAASQVQPSAPAPNQPSTQAPQPAPAQAQQPTPAQPSRWDNVSLWGYGEIYFTRPTSQPENTTADLARAVFGIGYKFNEYTRFNSEFEVEHAVTSSDDAGEFEVEQFYVDHNFNNWLSGQAGLFLIPAGLLNLHHEPTSYYGVTRNFVETVIIPTTWREGGVALTATTENGFAASFGVTTGLNLSEWEFNPTEPLYTTALELQNSHVAPMQATHQELALANAQHLSQYLSLNYTGVVGLQVGGSVFTGKMVKALSNIEDNQRVTLWEAHARWTPGKFDLSAVYAHGSFSNTAQANSQFPGATNPLPASFYGYYLQAAYLLWQGGESHLSPFVRAERYNMAASFDGVTWTVPGVAGFPQPHDTVYTAGLNYYLTPNVVFKADYQNFQVNRDFTRWDLGLGLSF